MRLGLFALCAVVAAGCSKTNELYCDDTTPCTDPARPFCDMAGVFPESGGHGRTCIANPGPVVDGGPDTGMLPDAAPIDAPPIDAPPIDAPMCVNNTMCGGLFPFCDVGAGRCRACATSTECALLNAATPECAPSGACVLCTASSQCGTGTTPICNSSNVCAACGSGTECMAKNPALPACASTGACVQCTMSPQCTVANMPICSPGNACVACATPGECAARSATTPQCNTGSGACVACLMSSHCTVPAMPICNGSNACVACANPGECAAKNPATPQCATTGANTGQCVVCTASSQCTASATMPICNASNLCAGCTSPTECMAKNPALPQCAGTGACVQCLQSVHCTTAANMPICGAGNSCRGCQTNQECLDRNGASLAKCNMTPGTCVQCLTSTDCPNAAPFCDTNVCRPCRNDGECSSGVCDETPAGTCVDALNIIYVNGTTGSASLPCGSSPAAACQTFQLALGQVAGSRRTIVAAQGTYNTHLDVNGINVRIVGQGTGAIIGSLSANPAIDVAGGSTVILENLTLQEAASSQAGLRCTGASVSATRVSVLNNDGLGVDANTCTLVLDRSTISINRNGGIRLTDSPYIITNSFIVENGRTSAGGSPVGGVHIVSVPGSGATRFAFNTVANNSKGGGVVAGGVECPAASATPIGSTIIWGNTGTEAATGCSPVNSHIEGVGGAADPMFLASSNFHVSGTSPVRGGGGNTNVPPLDIDGDPRPNPAGGNADIGADEVP